MKMFLIFSLLILDGCSNDEPALSGDQKDFNPSVLNQNKMIKYYAGNHPRIVILKYAQADLDNDGMEDLIVIYRAEKGNNQMCVIINKGLDFIETNSFPAPVYDQMIQFRDIDRKPPLEFILQGRKGANVGYAIFRIEEEKLTDLFGEGMEDCC